MPEPFRLRVLSPAGSAFDGMALSATLPTMAGEITVLAEHMPLIATLVDGELRIQTEHGEVSIAVAGGFLETGPEGATVLSDFAAEAESIEVARVQEAKELAQSLLSEKSFRGELLRVERELQRAVLQLRVAERYRSRRRPRTGTP